MFESALLPVNFNEPLWFLESLLRYLRNFGTQRVLLLHVVSSGMERPEAARKHLEEKVKTLAGEGYEVEHLIRSGSEAFEICNVASERNLDFICIPWKKKNPLQRTLLGSVGQDVVRISTRPVLIYKSVYSQKQNGQLNNILYATTLDPSHDQLLAYLQYERLNAQCLYLLHVGARAPDPDAERKRRKAVFTQLNRFKDECSDCFENVKPVTAVGNPKRGILKTARKYNVDLIVLGKHEQAEPLDHLLGSTSERIIHKAGCCILVIPTSGAKEA